MKRDAFDELDDLGPPPPLLVTHRLCAARGCRQHARSSGRYCRECHVRAVRRWRDTDRAAINERRREAAALRPESLRARDVARATLAMALKRGKIERGSCAVCATLNVIAYQYDPARPLDVAWVCRPHRAEFIKNAEQARQRASEHGAWLSRLEQCDRELPLLPLELQAAIRETASRGPAGVRLSSEAPLYNIALVAAFERAAALR